MLCLGRCPCASGLFSWWGETLHNTLSKSVRFNSRLSALKSPTYVFSEKMAKQQLKPFRETGHPELWQMDFLYTILMKIFNNSSVHVLRGVSKCTCLCIHTHCAMLHKLFKITYKILGIFCWKKFVLQIYIYIYIYCVMT